MNFTSQICTTKEQSERLLDLGLKKETADMYIFDTEVYIGKPNIDDTPAWSLYRLIEMCTGHNTPFQRVMTHNTYNEIISLIDELIKFNVFNKEYLEG